jgi:hypothetical protein
MPDARHTYSGIGLPTDALLVAAAELFLMPHPIRCRTASVFGICPLPGPTIAPHLPGIGNLPEGHVIRCHAVAKHRNVRLAQQIDTW